MFQTVPSVLKSPKPFVLHIYWNYDTNIFIEFVKLLNKCVYIIKKLKCIIIQAVFIGDLFIWKKFLILWHNLFEITKNGCIYLFKLYIKYHSIIILLKPKPQCVSKRLVVRNLKALGTSKHSPCELTLTTIG